MIKNTLYTLRKPSSVLVEIEATKKNISVYKQLIKRIVQWLTSKVILKTQ